MITFVLCNIFELIWYSEFILLMFDTTEIDTKTFLGAYPVTIYKALHLGPSTSDIFVKKLFLDSFLITFLSSQAQCEVWTHKKNTL